MKEKDYESMYKNALKWARGLYPNAVGADKEDLEHYFPELAESEDERIRKDLIDFFKDDAFLYHKKEEIIAWLEKQGEKSQYWKPSEEQLDALDYAYNSCPDTERGNYYEGVLETIIDDLHKLSEKQVEKAENCEIISEQKPAWSDEDEQGYEDVDWCIRKALQACNNEDETGTCWFAQRWVNSIKERLGGGK